MAITEFVKAIEVIVLVAIEGMYNEEEGRVGVITH